MTTDIDELTSEISPTLFSFKMRSSFIKLNYCLSSSPSLLLKDSASLFISNHVFEPITVLKCSTRCVFKKHKTFLVFSVILFPPFQLFIAVKNKLTYK